LISRYNKNEFSQSHLATIAIDFKMKTVELNGNRVKIQIWDTAGQERFSNLTNGFFKGSDGIVVTYSISDVKSFENVSKWMAQIQQRAPDDVKVVLAANKSDLDDERKISYSEGEQLALKYGVPFFETSAQNGNNVTELFEGLACRIIEKYGGKKNETNFTLQTKDSHTVGISHNQSNKCCSNK